MENEKINTENWLERTELLLGKDKLSKLQNANVLVVGLGGVGAYAAEQICRAGVGRMTLVDGDKVQPSNRNRQLIALASTQGIDKATLMGNRLLDINPGLGLTIINEYIKDDRMVEILDGDFDYVVDAIDTLAPKIYLIYHAVQKGLKIVSSMGAGGKFDPTAIKITDISESYNCTLARMLRKHIHRLGIREGFKVVFSTEKTDKNSVVLTKGEQNKKSTVGTISYMPPMFGCAIASVVIREIAGLEA
ncbi:MAG: tRNA threonylcarbamoyladenosine dehydratase [Bacteroidales bacterium]|nr:tRNA threonylcarbamoyladenosine dehydratase [Bacteroidales bacterium]MCF8457107.1 tRNA threonylcarbamoyladenosine dehydratase [Bacteroidales bacterium]